MKPGADMPPPIEIYKSVGERIAEEAHAIIERREPMTAEGIRAVSRSIAVKFRKPTDEQILSAKEWFESLGDGLIDSLPSRNADNYQRTHYALQALIIMADKRTEDILPLQVFKIGDFYIAGTSGQMFNEYGKRIKAACNGMCMVSIFANGIFSI